MLLEQLENLLKLSLQWVTMLLTLYYRACHQRKFDSKTGELAVASLLLFLVVWVEGVKLWVETAYRCYEFGRRFRKFFSEVSQEDEDSVKLPTTTEKLKELEEKNDLQIEPSPTPIKVKEDGSSSSLPLHSLSAKALKELAKQRKIKGYGRMTKAQLVATLSF